MTYRVVNILGTPWKLVTCKENESALLDGKMRDGATDVSERTIYICEKKQDCELQDYEAWKRIIMRHEIVHAFLFESGLDASSGYSGAWATNEEMVDWFALMSPKIFRLFRGLDIL